MKVSHHLRALPHWSQSVYAVHERNGTLTRKMFEALVNEWREAGNLTGDEAKFHQELEMELASLPNGRIANVSFHRQGSLGWIAQGVFHDHLHITDGRQARTSRIVRIVTASGSIYEVG